MERALRWWLANAGTAAVLIAASCGVAVLADEPLVASVLALPLGLSVVQGLRNLWAASRTRAALLTLGLPAAILASVVIEGEADASVLLLFAPAALAALAEWAARRWGVGLSALAPLADANPSAVAAASSPPAHRPSRWVVASGGVAALGLGTILLASHAITDPARRAEAFRASLHPGMSLADVAVAAWPHGRYYAFVDAAANAPKVRLETGAVRVGGEQAQGEAAVRALLERHAPTLGLRWASFLFRGMLPTRAVVMVHFGRDGRVERVDDPARYAD